MPWDMSDYPDSLKNLDKPVRKKAIDIANALIDDGYEEDRAIPIATAQAKEWYNNTAKKDIKQYEKEGKPTKRDGHNGSDPSLLDEPELVVPHENGWAVQSNKSMKPAKLFTEKSKAIQYGKDVAKNKGTKLFIYKKDNTIEQEMNYEKTE